MDTGQTHHDLNDSGIPAWRRRLLFAMLLALGLAYVGAFAYFVAHSDDFIARELRAKAREHARLQPISSGESLEFCVDCAGPAYLGTGWHRPENRGIWSGRPEAELFVAMAEPDAMTIEIEFTAFVDPKHGANTVVLMVDELEVGRWRIVQVSPTRVEHAVLPAAAAGTVRHLVLRADASRNHVLAGIGRDSRRLGVQLSRLTFLDRSAKIPDGSAASR
jgi:hypothetical protein